MIDVRRRGVDIREVSGNKGVETQGRGAVSMIWHLYEAPCSCVQAEKRGKLAEESGGRDLQAEIKRRGADVVCLNTLRWGNGMCTRRGLWFPNFISL